MTHSFPLSLLAASMSVLFLTGCGDAETTIIEKDPIVGADDGHDHGDGSNQSNDILIDSKGRLAITQADSNMLHLFDLDDNSQLDSMSTVHNDMTLSASADFRFVTLKARNQDLMQFVDSGFWREDHGSHLHDFEQGPTMTSFELTGSRPTHAISHQGQLAIFNDGDAENGIPASVHVVTDNIISTQGEPRSLTFATNMHGVAEPRGEHLLASIRRDDAESTSANKILPDQVGVFHLHDGAYELEQTLETLCPNLHGAAQNQDYTAFGCSDGVLVAHQDNAQYESVKIDNIPELAGKRVGNLRGHVNADALIGIASGHGGGPATLVSLDPVANTMQALEWQPEANPVGYAFSYDGEQFLVLDDQGYLNILGLHTEGGSAHWELASRLDISQQDPATMPEGMSFTMTVAQNGKYVYVSDPIAQHVLHVSLANMQIEGDIELDFAPAAIAWVGVAEQDSE
jgi:hypothetical protein